MKRIKTSFIILSPFAIGLFSLFIGTYDIPPITVIKILFQGITNYNGISNIPEKAIILDIRLPRILMAATVGASLAGSGAVLQGLLRNPLVDPYILGISAGAAFGCAITIGFLPSWSVQTMAFIFGLLAVSLTYMVAKSQQEISRLPLVLSGVIVSAFFTALVSIVKILVDPHKLQGIIFWTMGSFSLSDWRNFKIALIGTIVGILPIVLMRWRLNVMSLSEEEAYALGVNVKRDRMIFILFSTFSVAVATSTCGIIGWVGLMVPHIVRMMVGPEHSVLLPLSLFGGAAFMIGADTLSRTFVGFDVPVGIITALTGAPFFVYLMRKKGKETWES
ncbi:MAG: iron ABC transporter permease [Candidatus Bathyarchaeia archaeon]